MDFVDLSKVLASGVYVLRRNGRTVFVGTGSPVLAKIHAHAAHYRGGPTTKWLPAKPIPFDEVLLRTCRVDQLDAVYTEVCAEAGWAPEQMRA